MPGDGPSRVERRSELAEGTNPQQLFSARREGSDSPLPHTLISDFVYQTSHPSEQHRSGTAYDSPAAGKRLMK